MNSRKFQVTFFFATLILGCGQASESKQYPLDSIQINKVESKFFNKLPTQDKIICDFANVLSNDEEQALDSLTYAFYKDTRIGIAVAVLDSSQVPSDDFKVFTQAMFENWGTTDKAHGLYIVSCPSLRKVSLITGEAASVVFSHSDSTSVAKQFSNSSAPSIYKSMWDGILLIMKKIYSTQANKSMSSSH